MKNLYKGLLVTIWSVGLWLGAGAWVSAQTPVLLKTGAASNFVYGPNEMYFSLDGYLWKTDGTAAGTVQIKNNAGQPVDYTSSIGVIANSQFYFLSRIHPATYSFDTVLMYVDKNGIAQRVDLPAVLADVSIDRLVVANNQLYFPIYTTNNDYPYAVSTLWHIRDANSQAILFGTYNGSLSLATYKNKLYFFSDSKLWQADSAVSPIPLKVLNGAQLITDKDFLYLSARDDQTSRPILYKSDGSTATPVVVSIAANVPTEYLSTTSFYSPVIRNEQLYITVYSTSIRRYLSELLKVDPISNKLELATGIYGKLPAEITPISIPTDNFVFYNGLYYFAAGRGAQDNVELWRSDGMLVKDILPGDGSSFPRDLYVYDGKLYFSATANFIDRVLYRSDGTEAGTKPVTNITGSAILGGGLFFSFKNETYFSGNGGLYKLTTTLPTSPVTTSLTLTTPTYDCTTGQLTAQTSGGNGQPIEYRVAGLRDWAADNSFTVPSYQRNGTTFTLEARQSGAVVSLPFTSACQNTIPTTPITPAPPATTGLSLAQPTYDCTSGQLVLSTTGGNGSLVEYRIVGLRDWAATNTFAVPSYQRLGTTFTLEARQSGAVVSLPFTSACQSSTPTTPTTPPTGQALSVSAVPLNCQTGALQLITTGGDGTPIDYKVPGLGDYTSSPTFTVPTYQRTGTNFALYARQSGREVTGTYTAACPVGSRLASPETGDGLNVVVYPNPVSERFTVGVSGAAGQEVRFHLTNLQGQTVVEQGAQVVSDAHTETLKLPVSGAGMLLLRVSTPTQSQTVKVLRQ